MSYKILKFGKPNCSPCQSVDTFLKSKGVEFESINPFETENDEQDELVLKANVVTIPVTVLLKDGEIVSRKAGYNEKALQQLIDIYNGEE